MFILFFRDVTSTVGATVPFIYLNKTLLPPLIFHSFMFGLTSGKLVSGRVSSGFKVGLYLVIASLAGIWLTVSFQLFKFW